MSDILKKAQDIVDEAYETNYYEILVHKEDIDRLAYLEVNVLDKERITIPFTIQNVTCSLDRAGAKLKAQDQQLVILKQNALKSNERIKILERENAFLKAEKKTDNKLILYLSLAAGSMAILILIMLLSGNVHG